MSKLSLSGDPSGTGTFIIAAPNSNTDRTISLPDEAGTILTTSTNITSQALNGPAFRAYMANAQTISATTFTKLNFNTELFDTNSNYNTSTYRFTPTVAGYYQVTADTYFSATAQLYIYKNGAAELTGAYINSVGHCVSGLVYLNGSTDYVEVYYFGSAGITTTNNSSFANQFSGALVRAA